MRTLVAVLPALFAIGCGGGGKCEFPPCEIPPHRCDSHDDCFQNEFCNFERDTCGASPMDRGICVERPAPEDCTFEDDLVCGCDGQFHEGLCGAARAGTDVDDGANCALPPGAFSCGDHACIRDEQFCVELPDVDGSNFNCLFPAGECGPIVTCACARDFGCDECTEVNGEVRVKCSRGTPPPDQ